MAAFKLCHFYTLYRTQLQSGTMSFRIGCGAVHHLKEVCVPFAAVGDKRPQDEVNVVAKNGTQPLGWKDAIWSTSPHRGVHGSLAAAEWMPMSALGQCGLSKRAARGAGAWI